MRSLWIVVAIAGCVDPNLVPCGDRACPSGDVCLAASGRCVTPGQLAGCGGVVPGSDCAVNGVTGKCVDGACTPVICGNGVVDPGEICDDGNQVSGDGCSGTCTSLEVCGNGVVDVARGEGCDCGDAAQPSPLCTHPNSADLQAECDLACHPRFCGDGVIDTIEQCDGAVPSTTTCADFGFYGGAPSCSTLCQIDPSGCTGRCGDGAIDADHGEFCDGVMPAAASCVAFGYDLGALTCTDGCGPDLQPCHQFGWSRAHDVNASARDLWGGAGRIAVVYQAGDAWLHHDGAWERAPDTYAAVTGTDTTVWAVGPDHLAHYTAGAWTTDVPPWPSGTAIASTWASDTLGLFVSTAGASDLYRYTGGVWTTVSGSWTAGSTFHRTRTNLWLRSGDNTTTVFDGTTWTPFAEYQYIDAATEDDTGALWLSSEVGLVRGSPGAWVTVGLGHVSALAPATGGIFVADVEHAAGHAYNDLWFVGQPPLSVGDLPGPLIASDGKVPYSAGSNGLFALEYGAWRSYDVEGFLPNFIDLPGGPSVRSGDSTADMLDDVGAIDAVALPESSCSIAGVTSSGAVLAGCTGGLYQDTVVIEANAKVDALWATRDDDAAAASGVGSAFGGSTYGVAYRTGGRGGAWHTTSTTREITHLAGDAVDDLYGVGADDLFHFDGTTWTVVATGIDSSVTPVVTPTRVYVLGTTYDRATGAVTASALPANTWALVGTGGEELFAVAAAETRGSPLWRYDGARWTPVRIPLDVSAIFGVATTNHDVILRSNRGAFPPIDYLLQRTGPW